jgi:NAD(P)-dependent dehydrogenase (short-subunit alcohol dehydrogenase family)
MAGDDALFQGKNIVIVGGGSGIGLEVARACQRRGASLFLIGRTEGKLKAAAESLGGSTKYEVADVVNEEQIETAFSRIGFLHHLFVSAQDTDLAPVSDLTMFDHRKTLDSKVWGALHCAKHAAPLIPKGGSITFISGLSGRRGYPGFALAGAANAAIEAVARNLAVELAPVRVNTVCAGMIDTETLERLFGENRNQLVEEMASRLPVERIGTVKEVADAVIFLMSNGFATGSTLVLDGGDTLV